MSSFRFVADPSLAALATPADPIVSMSVELPESVLTKLERHVSAIKGVGIDEVLTQAIRQYLNGK